MSELSPACTGKVTALNIINQGLAAACCNKLIKRENFIYEFEVGKVNEDVAVIIPTLANAKKISYFEYCKLAHGKKLYSNEELKNIEKNELPKDLHDDEKIANFLPAFYRTLRKKELDEKELKELLELIKKSGEEG